VILFADFGPALAAGTALAAVGAPLLIHLLFRKRYQIVPWAAIRFLLVAERRHRRRIDQWLLLALRILALLLPLFAMVAATHWVEPLWQAIKPGAAETVTNIPRTHHVLVLDATLSMTARIEGGQTRFDKAVAEAEKLIRSGSAGDGYTLLVLANGVQPIINGPANDAEKVIAELRKVKPTHTAATISSALPTIAEILARSPRAYPRRQVTFLTDAQRSAWASCLPKTDSQPPELWQRIFHRAEVAIVDVARVDVGNLAVTDIALVDPIPLVDSHSVVVASVTNHGATEYRNVRVQLLLGRPSAGSDALVPVQQGIIDVIQPGGRASITFGLEQQVRFREKGIHILQAKVMETDDLSADDARSIAVQVRDGLHTILVDGSVDAVPLWRSAGYLSLALYPPDVRPADTPARPRIMTPAEFADPVVGDLSGIDCVYLCDLPNITLDLAAKLESLLKRGGGVVIGFGPNSAANIPVYNRVLYNDGNGILPGQIVEPVSATSVDEPGFRFTAEEEAYHRPPLLLFRDENIRAQLINVPFKTYLRLDAPQDGRARRILSFAPANGVAQPANRKPDPALVEWNRHRGRVVVFTSSFNEDWNHWPPLRTYLPFQQELLRFAASNPDRHTVQVGDAIEEFFPAASVGLKATLTGPEGLSVSIPAVLLDDAGVVRYGDTRLSGLHRLKMEGQPERTFAVNVPDFSPGAGSESDLKRIDPTELKKLLEPLGSVQTVADVSEIAANTQSGAVLVSTPKPHGPMIARFVTVLAIATLFLEMLIAWRWGPARATGAGTTSGSIRTVDRKWYVRIISTALALLPLIAAVAVVATIVHYERTGNLLGFLPAETRHWIEDAAGVPAAQPGEGTKWRLEGFTAFVRNALVDRRIVLAIAAIGVALTFFVYRMERRAVSGFRRLIVPALLRLAVLLLTLFLLLPQLRLSFDREGWPEVVILIDTSASMSTVDNFKDPAVRAKAEELLGAVGLPPAQRLKLAQLLLTRSEDDWLKRLLREKEVKVHIYTVDAKPRQIKSLEQESDIAEGRSSLMKLKAEGDSSHLGDGVELVLKAFQGNSLSAIIMFTDGVTTAGDDLPKAAREASRAGVPLYLVGVGDSWETPDLELNDLQAEDTITVGDRLVFDARLTARGQVPTDPLRVILYEKVRGQLVERGQTTVVPNATGTPVSVTVTYTPTEPGEKTFVLVAPTVPGETDASNNKLERTVFVSDAKRLRVLYVEGYPRYDFRFVKVLLERESERSLGGKGVELEVVLLDAAKGWLDIDRSAFRGDFPTRDQLFTYDAVILGDIDPKQLPRTTRTLQDLADFVRIKGGGLLFLCGQHSTPTAYADTALAEILPVVPGDGSRDKDEAMSEEFRPRLTDLGRRHSLFRFAPDDTESANIWNSLPPLYWYAHGYRQKPNTSVLAVHPRRIAEGGKASEGYPLVIQAHVGAGSVLFIGFDDTWRWRFRHLEEHFDRFWIQAIRVLSRSRARRVELKVSPKSTFRRDEKMTVVVQFPVESLPPSPGQPIRVTLARGPLTNPDGSRGPGSILTTILSLTRVPGIGVQYETTLTRTPEGEYRFTLTEPEPQPGMSAPSVTVQVLPPLNELDRVEMNVSDLQAAAAVSNGAFYTLATADNVFDDLKNLQKVPLNQPCSPIELWNHPISYLLILLLLVAEWLLRKRERLL
jgi:hypothetical protein